MRASPRLRLRLFGSAIVDCEGDTIEIGQASTPIVSYMVLERDRPVSRVELAGAIWPERTDARARRCLSTALWRLKAHPALAHLLDTSNHESIRLNRRRVPWIDVIGFERRISNLLRIAPDDFTRVQYRQLGAAIALYRDDLLRTSDFEWVLLERQRLRNLYLDGLQHLTLVADALGDSTSALHHGRRFAALEPLREDAHRLLMRLYAASGNRAKAIEQYRICEGELSTELNVDPTAETRALFESLLGDAPPMPSSAERQAASMEALGARVRYARRALAAADLRLADALQLLRRAQLASEQV